MATIGLVHGLGGSSSTMARLAEALEAAGHSTLPVTLPGHDTVPDDLLAVGWADWLAAVPDATVLVGQSLGAALVLAAASQRKSVAAVVCINPPAPDPDAIDGLEWRMSRGHEWIDAPPAGENEQAYQRLPMRALLAMAQGVDGIDYAAVTQPVLVITSADDDVIDPASSDTVAELLGGPVTRVALARGGHTASLGPELDSIVSAVLALLRP